MESPAQVPDMPPKRKGRRIRRALSATWDIIECHVSATTIVVVAVLLLVASWIYPPWVRYPEHDWHFIFDTNTGAMRIDVERLVLIDLIIAAPLGLFAWAISGNSATRRTAFRVAFSLVAAVCLLVLMFLAFCGSVVVSALAGNAKAQSKVAGFYSTHQDLEAALKWWRKAAEQADTDAQYRLAYHYDRLSDHDPDGKAAKEAAKWYGVLAAKGEAGAQDTLGEWYLMGKGVHRDYVEAYFWLTLSGWSANAFHRRELEGALTPEQIAFVRRRVAEFVPAK